MTDSKIKRVVKQLSLIIVITVILLEISLRIFPSVIPIHYLVLFNPLVRSDIAARRGFPVERRLMSVPRDDYGPSLKIFQPFTKYIFPSWKDKDALEYMNTDHLGFCNPSYKNRGVKVTDVLVLGDSFTWCNAVLPEESWPAILEKNLGRTVYNMGRGGIGLYEEVQLLKWFGLEMKPEIVIVNLYEGNDVRDALFYWAHRTQFLKGDPTESGEQAFQEPHSDLYDLLIDTYVNKHIYLTNLLLAATENLKSTVNRKMGTENIDFLDLTQEIDENSYVLLVRHLAIDRRFYSFTYHLKKDGIIVAFNTDNKDMDEANLAYYLDKGRVNLDMFVPALEELYSLSREHDFRLILLYTPTAYTAYEKYIEFDDPALDSIMKSFSRLQREFLKARTGQMGIEFVDMTPYLQSSIYEHSLEDLLYFPRNLHLTRLGHDVFANELAAQLDDMNQ